MSVHRLLCWNVANKPRAPLAAQLAKDVSADFAVLVEADDTTHSFGGEAHASGWPMALAGQHATAGISVWTRSSIAPPTVIQPANDGVGKRAGYLLFSSAGGPPTLLVNVHLPSKLHRDPIGQRDFARITADDIWAVADVQGTDRIVIVGDFNMHPFEPGMVDAPAFFATPTPHLSDQYGHQRTVDSVAQRYFVNPMWRFFDGWTQGPRGTYFSNKNEHAVGWSLFDQVLYSPALVSLSTRPNISILDTIGGTPLMDQRGRPVGKDKASDHLPILVDFPL